MSGPRSLLGVGISGPRCLGGGGGYFIPMEGRYTHRG